MLKNNYIYSIPLYCTGIDNLWNTDKEFKIDRYIRMTQKLD